MKTILALSVIGLFILSISLFNKKDEVVVNNKKDTDLIFSSINQKNLNEMKLKNEQKERLLEIKVRNLKFSSF